MTTQPVRIEHSGPQTASVVTDLPYAPNYDAIPEVPGLQGE